MNSSEVIRLAKAIAYVRSGQAVLEIAAEFFIDDNHGCDNDEFRAAEEILSRLRDLQETLQKKLSAEARWLGKKELGEV